MARHAMTCKQQRNALHLPRWGADVAECMRPAKHDGWHAAKDDIVELEWLGTLTYYRKVKR